MNQYPYFRQELSEQDVEELKKNSKVLKLTNKLLMKEGTHNGVFYPGAELKSADIYNQSFGLYYDHADATANWVGEVIPRFYDEATRSIMGDVIIVDDQVAKKQAYGAKWGLSPTVDVEKMETDQGPKALNPQFVSWSLVLDPAVKETMLNSKLKNGGALMSEEDLAKKKKKKEEEEMKAKYAELEKEHSAATKRLEELEKAELQRECEKLADYEISFGRITAELKESRIKELMEMSKDARAILKIEHDWIVDSLKLKDDPDLSDDELARKKKKEEEEKELQIKKKKYPYPYPPTGKDKEKMSRENLMDQARKEGREAGVTRGDVQMLAFMRENQNRNTIFPGGAR